MRLWALPLVLSVAASSCLTAQPTRDEVIDAARAIVAAAPFASLATVDSLGRPDVRVMDAAAPDSAFVVWLATNPRSRKVDQMRNRPVVALHWVDPAGPGYVTLVGRARLVDDPTEKRAHWKASCDPFYPAGADDAVLLEVVPHRLEVISIPAGLEGDPDTWRAEVVEFDSGSADD